MSDEHKTTIILIFLAILVLLFIPNEQNENFSSEKIHTKDITMIEGKCFTYLDEFKKISWPTHFCIGPVIGQRVESFSTPVCSLRIQQIIHCEKPSLITGADNIPYLKIELR